MATLTFSFDTGTVPISRIVDAMALEYGYSATLPDGSANPQTKAQFGKAQIGRIIREAVRNQEASAAKITAEAAVTAIVLT